MTYCNHSGSQITNIDFPKKISSMNIDTLEEAVGNSSLFYVRIDWIPTINKTNCEEFCAIGYTKFVSPILFYIKKLVIFMSSESMKSKEYCFSFAFVNGTHLCPINRTTTLTTSSVNLSRTTLTTSSMNLSKTTLTTSLINLRTTTTEMKSESDADEINIGLIIAIPILGLLLITCCCVCCWYSMFGFDSFLLTRKNRTFISFS